MMQKIGERPCYDRGNGSPFCSPVASDTWYNGSFYEFVWNYNYPYYVTSEYINLFLYYKENYAFQPIKNWTNMHRADGQLAVQVDDTWFPSLLAPSSANTTWSLYGLYLPAGKDPASELTNPESQYPRPFNFSVVQPSYTSNNPALYPSDSHGSRLPGWAVAIIVVGSLGAAAAAAAIAACLIARKRKNKNDDTLIVIPAPEEDAKLETDSSIYSTTPIIVGTASNASTPRLSGQYCNNSSSRRSSGMIPHNRSGLSNYRSSGSFDDTSSRKLASSTFMWMVESPDNEEDEQRRRKLGEALLAQQLQTEEGASVKHAERRPITVNDGVSGQESHAVFEERS